MFTKRNLIMLCFMAVLMFSFGGTIFAANANAGNKSNISDILGNELISKDQADFNDKKLQGNIANIVGIVRLVGLGIAFIMVIITGILFATSGKNEQRRSAAFLSLIGVAAGIFCMMQAAMIASWFASIGT